MAIRTGIFWRSLKSLFQSPLERERDFYSRYRELSDKIEAQPESFTHYVLRGELFVERGEYERARADFEAAAEIAGAVDPNEAWGLLEQVMRDRALQGIEYLNRRR